MKSNKAVTKHLTPKLSTKWPITVDTATPIYVTRYYLFSDPYGVRSCQHVTIDGDIM